MVHEFSASEARLIGEAIGVNWRSVDADEFRRGLAVELEHGERDPETNISDDDLIVTGKIAWAHLKEVPDYYTRLAKVEKNRMRRNGSPTSPMPTPWGYKLVGHKTVHTGLDTGIEQIAFDRVGDKTVSTIFLGRDAAHNDLEPVLFERMLHDDNPDTERTWFGGERYSTWDEAMDGHARAIAELKEAARPRPFRTLIITLHRSGPKETEVLCDTHIEATKVADVEREQQTNRRDKAIIRIDANNRGRWVPMVQWTFSGAWKKELL